MKSCSSLFATLLFVTGSILAASACQIEPQSIPSATASVPATPAPAGENTSTEASVAPRASAAATTSEPASARILAPGTTIVAEFAGSLNVKKRSEEHTSELQ